MVGSRSFSKSKRQVGNLISCETGETISAFPEKLVFSGDLINEGRRVSSANVFKRFKVRKSHLHLLFFPLLLYGVCVVVEVVDYFFFSSEKIKREAPGGPVIRTRCFYNHRSGFDPWLGNLRLHRPLWRGLFPRLHLTKMQRIKFGKTIY